jgi:hypothetical protein
LNINIGVFSFIIAFNILPEHHGQPYWWYVKILLCQIQMLSIYEAGTLHTMVTNNKGQTIPHSPGQLYMSCRVSFSHTQILFISNKQTQKKLKWMTFEPFLIPV